MIKGNILVICYLDGRYPATFLKVRLWPTAASVVIFQWPNAPLSTPRSVISCRLSSCTTGSRLSRNDKPRHEALPLEDEKQREPHIGVDHLDHRNAGPAE